MSEKETKKSIFEMIVSSLKCKCENGSTLFSLGWNYSARYHGKKDQKLCECEEFNSCFLCAKSTDKIENVKTSGYQKAVEEINGMIESKPKQEDRNCLDWDLAAEHDELLKKIYAITNGDFSEKTEWLPINELTEKGELFWLADKDNNTAEGYFTEAGTISVIKSESEDFGTPVIFTKIKPPKILIINTKDDPTFLKCKGEFGGCKEEFMVDNPDTNAGCYDARLCTVCGATYPPF